MMMDLKFKYEVKNLDQLADAAVKFFEFLQAQPHKIVAFHGAMGAGKTTFIKALLKEMETADFGSSPTFALVSEYHSDVHGRIVHCDFYRLKTPEEAYDIGIEEILDDTCWCFVEWPEKLGNLLPHGCVHAKITDQNGLRTITASV